MTTEATELVTELADRLGTTADRLWSALVAQAPVDAWCGLAVRVLFVFLVSVLAYLWVGFIRSDKGVDDLGQWSSAASACCGVQGVVSVLMVIWLGCLIESTPIWLSGWLNPEYWALQQILGR